MRTSHNEDRDEEYGKLKAKQRELREQANGHFTESEGALAQRKPGLHNLPYVNDHQSPVKPAPYVMLRLRPQIRRLRRKIPIYSRLRFTFQVLVLGCVSASAALSFYAVRYVAIVSSVAAALTSWMAYSEFDTRLTIYSNAVRELNQLSSTWDSLREVEKKTGTFCFIKNISI